VAARHSIIHWSNQQHAIQQTIHEQEELLWEVKCHSKSKCAPNCASNMQILNTGMPDFLDQGLYPYHSQCVKALQPENYAAQVDFCRLQDSISLWNTLCFVMTPSSPKIWLPTATTYTCGPQKSSKFLCKQLPAWLFGECMIQFCRSPTKWANHFWRIFSSRLLLLAFPTKWATYFGICYSPGQTTHDCTPPHFV
jgi:hypothetical protein